MRRLSVAVLGLAALVGCNEECPSKGKTEMKSESASTGEVTGTPVVLSVKEMMCQEGCAKRVEEILAKAPGVKKATVQFEEKQAHLVVDPSAFDADKAVAELKTAGYPTEVVSASQ